MYSAAAHRQNPFVVQRLQVNLW